MTKLVALLVTVILTARFAYAVQSEAVYQGCYVDVDFDYRVMKGDKIMGDGQMTHEKCFQFCKSRNYSYAGLQFRLECFCDNKLPKSHMKTCESECNLRCSGNSLETCGGTWRLSVYKIA